MPRAKGFITNEIVIILLRLSILLSECVCGNLYEENDHFISGAEEIPVSFNFNQPIFYNTYVPLIYEFNLPKYDIHTMKIQYWKLHNNCTESDSFQEGYPCPVMYHMNKIIDSLAKNYTIWENLFPTGMNGKIGRENDTEIKLPSLKGMLCSEIVSHFKHFQSSIKSLENYLRALKNCPLGSEISIELNKDKYVYNLEEMYHAAFTPFPEAYYGTSPEPTDKGMTLNAWTSLQTGLLMNHYIESNRWTNALSSCQAKMIPYSLIDLPSLEKVIRETILPKINKKGYKLSVPLDELSSYFKLPLADCIFASKKFLFVRILIPITKVDKSYTILSFKPIPFWKRTGDNGNRGEFCSIGGIDSKIYVSDKKSQFIQETNCKANDLCQIAESANIPYSNIITNPCVSALNRKSKKDILGMCPLNCRKFSTDDDNFLLIMPSSSLKNIFFIAGGKSREENIRIECPGKTAQVVPNLEFGAWNLSLHCKCQIIKDNQVFLSDETTCRNLNQSDSGSDIQLNIFPVKPYHWDGMTDEQLLSSGQSFSSKSGAFSFSKDFHENGKAESSPVVSMADVNEFVDSKYSTILTQQIFLWILILLQVIVMAVLSYFVYNLKKWKQDEIHRRNRLVYNDATDLTEHF